MSLKISEQYEELAIEWQYQMILILKNTLAKFGVNEDQEKEIVGKFAFDFSMLHDQGEIKLEDNSFNPRISFDDFSGNVILSDEESNLHEYAFGNTSEAYCE